MGALTKPLFAIAPTTSIGLMARLLNRVRKGICGAPRDALVADVTPAHLLGAAFGLRPSLDTESAFLVLHAKDSGIPLAMILLVMVAMNVVYLFSAYPFGKLSDRIRHSKLLALGLFVLIAADLVCNLIRRITAVKYAAAGYFCSHLCV